VDRFIPAANKFIHFNEDDQKKGFGFKPKVYLDRKGNIWIGNDGLFKFNLQQQQFKRITNIYSNKFFGSKLANNIKGFYCDSKNHYWVSTNDGLFLYNNENKSFLRFDVPPKDESYKKFGILFTGVYEDENGELWVGTWGYGIFKILVAEKKLIPVGKKGVVLTYTSQKLNGEELFWNANNGLIGINTQQKTQTHVQHKSDDPYSLRKDAIEALFTDKQGQLWIGYATQGIQILSPGNQLVKTYAISSSHGNISSVGVIAKHKNVIYVGGWYNDALHELSNNYKIIREWKYLPPDKNKSSSNVSDLYFDKKDNVWLATFNGLVCINKKTTVIKTYKQDSSVTINNRFLKILPEGDSVLWLAGYKNGLSKFCISTHHFELYGTNPKPTFWNITYDKVGNIWCTNNNGWLEKFDRLKKSFSTFIFDTLTEKSIYTDIVYDSVSNILFVGTSNGLLKVSLNNLRAQLFTEKEGLPANKINLLSLDDHHRLWISTDRGLSLYNQQKKSISNFYMNNGLSTEKIDQSLSVEEDGKLYIGSNNNIMTMDIAGIDNKAEVSPVYITGVSENGNLLQATWKNSQAIIDLPYNQNSLSFEFAIIDFINSEDNQLSYQLEGWDKDFIQTKKGEANYNKLLPGKYIFRVKGINHRGVKNEKGDAITIIIHPPFWQTWWFILLVSAALLTVLIFWVRYISLRNLKEKLLRLEKDQAIEKERNRISKDMHDDLGSGLTKIAIMSEVVKKQIHEPEKAKQQLENISATSRELVDNLQDIIWILNPKNDTLENLAAYIREYTLKFFEPFGVEIQFHYPENFSHIQLSEETRRNIFLTVKEIFNNIAKHAWCNTVQVTIIYSSTEINLTIKDDGKGFDLNNVRQFGNGLINMQNRIEQIGGKYEIVSEQNKGTKTKIEIPHTNDFRKPS
jgi:signal transduction histidine kinase/ligand-binding sensor domain-containing protein